MPSLGKASDPNRGHSPSQRTPVGMADMRWVEPEDLQECVDVAEVRRDDDDRAAWHKGVERPLEHLVGDLGGQVLNQVGGKDAP